MATRPNVTPNRRGARSREAVLDAAERLMSEHGYEAATVARVVEETGIPASSVYHYFGSKDGVLLAVMQRGSERFFNDLPDPGQRAGTASEHLAGIAETLIAALGIHPNFLRLLIVFAAQPSAAGDGQVDQVVNAVRDEALARLRRQFALAFDGAASDQVIDRLARFALAAIDGAFIAHQADRAVSIRSLLTDFPIAIVAMHTALRDHAG